MSVDYYLVSPGRKKAVMVGSTGFGGVQPYPGTPEVVRFVRWAIEHGVEDIVWMNEYVLDELRDSEGWPDDFAQESHFE
jgi:hypothetical protein